MENGDDYPYVFNNDTVDGSFGVTSPIILDELTPSGLAGGLNGGAQQHSIRDHFQQ